MPVLIGMSGSIVGIVFDLSEDEVSIGRLEDNLIVLDDPSVSGNHALLSRQSNVWLLEDLKSTNGTRVNGQPIGETVLQERDEVQFGAIQLVYTETDPIRFDLNELTELDEPAHIAATAKPGQPPTILSNPSPFKAHKKQKGGLWNIILLLIAIVAMAGVGMLFYLLFVTR